MRSLWASDGIVWLSEAKGVIGGMLVPLSAQFIEIIRRMIYKKRGS